MSCCDQLPGVFEYSGKLRSLLDERVENVDTKNGGWLSLHRCLTCGQHWQVDADDPYEVGLAIRIDEPSSWHEYDDTSDRTQHLINTSAGLDDDSCIWKGCERRRLKGVVYCPLHMYETGARRFPAHIREQVLRESSS